MSSVENLNNGNIQQKKRPFSTIILGITSIVTSLFSLGFLLGVIGLFFGVKNLIKIKRNQLDGMLVVWAGILLCLIGIGMSISFSVSFGNNLFI